jgi:phage shock protein A
MAILKRIKRIVRSNVNELLDQFENTDASLALSIEELNDQIEKTRTEAARAEMELGEVKQAEVKLQEALSQIDSQTREKVRQGDDAAARSCIGARLDLEEELRSVNASIREDERRCERTKKELQRLHTRLEALEQKRVELKAKEASDAAFEDLKGDADLNVEVDEEIAEEVARQEPPVKSLRDRKIDEVLEQLKREVESSS